MDCLICAILHRRLTTALRDLENASGWLKTIEVEPDAIAYERARVAEADARIEADMARVQLEQHEREH